MASVLAGGPMPGRSLPTFERCTGLGAAGGVISGLGSVYLGDRKRQAERHESEALRELKDAAREVVESGNESGGGSSAASAR